LTIKIGIPRATFYYEYFPMAQTFFNELGLQVITSAKTSREILNAGIQKAHADTCVPVKAFYGHVESIKNKVDFLFIPRITCLNGQTVYCPKFLGLPDMMRHAIDDVPEIIDTCIDVRTTRFAVWKAFYSIGRRFTNDKFKILKAYIKSLYALKKYKNLLMQGLFPEEAIKKLNNPNYNIQKKQHSTLHFAVLGYPYTVYDEFTTVDLLSRLKKLGVQITTIEQVPYSWIKRQHKKLPKRMFWTYSDAVVKSAFHFFEHKSVDGIIHITTFACGPDSMVIDYLKFESQNHPDMPFMSITIDEHSGEAGIHTRLEAFVDMVKRKKMLKMNTSEVYS